MYLLRTLRSPCTSRPPIPPIPRQQRGGGPHAHHAHPERARHLPSWRRGTAELLCLLHFVTLAAEKMELAAAPVVLPAGQWGLRRRAVVETKRLPVASTARPAAARDARSNGSQPLPEQTQQELEARAVAERAEAVAMAAGLNEGRDDDDDPGRRHRPRHPSGTFPGLAGARLGLVFLAVQAVMFVVNMCAPCAPPLSTASFLSYAWRMVTAPPRVAYATLRWLRHGGSFGGDDEESRRGGLHVLRNLGEVPARLKRRRRRRLEEHAAAARALKEEALELARRLDTVGAIELLRKAKRLDPLDPETPLFLSKCLSDRVFEPQLFGTNAAKKLAQQAVNLSRRVMHKNPDLPLAHVAYATNCGRLTMFCDNKERVRIAGDVRASALRALELQPGDDLALHVLGRWEMEMAGLGAVTRAFAKMLYGDLGNGCNHRAATCFRDAAAAQPTKLIHKVCLAKCLLKTGQRDESKTQLLTAMRLKVDDVNALCERKDGVELLRKHFGVTEVAPPPPLDAQDEPTVLARPGSISAAAHSYVATVKSTLSTVASPATSLAQKKEAVRASCTSLTTLAEATRAEVTVALECTVKKLDQHLNPVRSWRSLDLGRGRPMLSYQLSSHPLDDPSSAAASAVAAPASSSITFSSPSPTTPAMLSRRRKSTSLDELRGGGSQPSMSLPPVEEATKLAARALHRFNVYSSTLLHSAAEVGGKVKADLTKNLRPSRSHPMLSYQLSSHSLDDPSSAAASAVAAPASSSITFSSPSPTTPAMLSRRRKSTSLDELRGGGSHLESLCA